MKKNYESGVSFIELLLVVAVIGILVLLISNLPNSINLVGRSRHASTAREIASKLVEDTRVMQYTNLSNGDTNITSAIDPRIDTLPFGAGIKRVEDCDVCAPDENVKKVTVTIDWKDAGKDQQLKIVTLIGEGGINK